MEQTHFPTDETLAAFVDGRLDEAERKRVLDHINTCDDCWATYDALMEFKAQNGAEVSATPRAWWWASAAGIGLAAALAGIVFLLPIFRRDDRAAIFAAAPRERPFAGRLAGFPYHEMKAVMRGGDSDKSSPLPENAKLYEVAAKIEDKGESVENLHNLGDAWLLAGDASEAVAKLGEALAKQTVEKDLARAIAKSSDAVLLNDFSAAAAANNDGALALAAAGRSFSISKTPEAAWNRVVASEMVHGPEAAATSAAKADYEKLADAPEWRTEFRTHIAPAP